MHCNIFLTPYLKGQSRVHEYSFVRLKANICSSMIITDTHNILFLILIINIIHDIKSTSTRC